ncbi:MAG: Molybdopterin molybdenumtransferase (EC [uncultured Caballeronia sp.]|nr:MAG: Molybdopterin molybdenumtransferase (EC [uncultured Caballeronia sp.]
MRSGACWPRRSCRRSTSRPCTLVPWTGYAVRAADLAEPLAAGTVARIFTGATVPPGADTIVM